MLKQVITLIVLLIFLSSCATQPIGGGSPFSSNPCQRPAPSAASSFLQSSFANNLMNFGGNLLATAATNYSQKYTGKLEKFLTKLVTPKKKRNRSQQQDDFGNGDQQDQFPQDQFPQDGNQDFTEDSDFNQEFDPSIDSQGQFEGTEEGFDPNQFQDEQGQQFDEQDDQQFDEQLDPQFADQPVSRGVPGRFPIGQPEEDPCAQTQAGPDGQPYEDPNGYDPNQSEQAYNQEGSEYGQEGEYAQQEGYDQESGNDTAQDIGTAIGLDVALVRKTIRNGTPVILPIKDGDLLRDGRGNPHAGDKFRIMFRPNSEAYVYVVAIDGSGWAQGIFPSPTSPFANPVQANQQYVVPEETNWFSLDQFQGVETIFFIASSEPRQDIEDLLKGIMGRERPASATPRQVTKAAIVPNGYSGAQPSQTPFGLTLSSGGHQEILPTSFLAKTAGEDLRITRWFRHQ